jgi:hypothetical protein
MFVRPSLFLLLSLAAVTPACERDKPTTAPDGELAAPEAFDELDPGGISMRRLTAVQVERSLKDILGEKVVVPTIAEPEVVQGGLISVGASTASFSARGIESIEKMAFSVAEQVFQHEEMRAPLIPCAPTATRDDACTEEVFTTLARLIWRRPLTSDEVGEIVALSGDAADALEDFHGGLEFGLARLLQSPHFLFRSEIGENDPESNGRRFGDYELASRLSFFLWNTSPDSELIAAADSGALQTREGLLEEADRLLASPRAREGLAYFFEDYLDLGELTHLNKDPTLFEHYNSDVGEDAKEETLRLIDHIVFELEADFRDIMTTRSTFINPNLAAIYGVPAPDISGFGYMEHTEDSQRIGIATHTSFLSAHSHAVSSSATLRGKAVRLVLLCQDIPAPPVSVDTSIPEPSGNRLTLRDRVAEHLENPSCAGCHILTDPIGLGLETFDGLGRWRDFDNGARIDASGDLDGTDFRDAKELVTAIREHPAFAPCVVRTLARYAIGRTESRDEKAWLKTLSERFSVHDHRLIPTIRELIASPLFRQAGEPN